MSNKNNISFYEIPFNKTEISQDLLNIADKRRNNIFAWRGQFSPQFVEAILKQYTKKGDVILDTFSGVGTVLYESARLGLSVYGNELNISAYYLSKIYELINIMHLERLELVKSVEYFIYNLKDEAEIIISLSNEITRSQNQLFKNILSALIILLDLFNNEIDKNIIIVKWLKLRQIILELPYGLENITVMQGDSRSLKMVTDVADFLLTSPPYINVFNYHQKYRRSVEALGFNVLNIAKSEIGSNRKNRGNRLLTVVQYCIDMALSIQEAIRVCRKNARMVYVVGRESSVLEYSFCNSKLIYEIFTQIFQTKLILKQERCFKNRFGKVIYEDILHFENSKHYAQENEIINHSMRIAEDVLISQLHDSKHKNINFLENAISNTFNVKKSEVIDV